MSNSRPRIAIPGRLAESTSATRYAGIVTARRLAELIWDAGGEPLTFLPVAEQPWGERLVGIDGILMPGGADVDPRRYGQEHLSAELYGINSFQDEADFSLFRHAIESAIPLLTICRGTQVGNVALGGSLLQHMTTPHMNHASTIEFSTFDAALGLSEKSLNVSCFHHQSIDRLGAGITPLAFAKEGHIEAVRFSSKAWAFGLQWHPEDNYDQVPNQLLIAKAFVDAARG